MFDSNRNSVNLTNDKIMLVLSLNISYNDSTSKKVFINGGNNMTTEKQFEQAKEIVKLLESKYNTNGYLGVEIDYPFDSLERYTGDYTIVNCLFENVLDEVCILHENLKYGEEVFGLTKLEAKSHIRKLQKFIKENSKKYFQGNEVYEYLKKMEEITK